MIAADGREVHVWERDTIIRDDDGEPLFTQGVVVDISELRAAEHDLRDERDRAQRYLDVAGTIIVVLDRDERVALLNRTGHDLLRFVEGELVGQQLVRPVRARARPRERPRGVFRELIAGRVTPSTESYENAVVTQDGEERVIMLAQHGPARRGRRRSPRRSARASTSPSAGAPRSRSPTSPTTTRSPACPTARCWPSTSSWRIARARRGGARASRCCTSTSTTSSSSTTPSATRPATSCCCDVCGRLEARRRGQGPARPPGRRRVPAADRRRRRRRRTPWRAARGRRAAGQRWPSPSRSQGSEFHLRRVDRHQRVPRTTPTTPRRCCATPTPRCTRPRPPGAAASRTWSGERAPRRSSACR